MESMTFNNLSITLTLNGTLSSGIDREQLRQSLFSIMDEVFAGKPHVEKTEKQNPAADEVAETQVAQGAKKKPQKRAKTFIGPGKLKKLQQRAYNLKHRSKNKPLSPEQEKTLNETLAEIEIAKKQPVNFH